MQIPLPRIPRQVGRVQIWRLWYFFKQDIQPRGIRAKVPFLLHVFLCHLFTSVLVFVVSISRFHSPRSLVLYFFFLYYTLYLYCLFHVFLYNNFPPQFRSSFLLVSTRFHIPCLSLLHFIYVSLSECPNHPYLAFLIFSLMFGTPSLLRKCPVIF